MSYFPLCVVGAAVQQFLGAVADTYHVFLQFRHVLKWLLSSSMTVNSVIFTALSDILSAIYPPKLGCENDFAVYLLRQMDFKSL